MCAMHGNSRLAKDTCDIVPQISNVTHMYACMPRGTECCSSDWQEDTTVIQFLRLVMWHATSHISDATREAKDAATTAR